MSRAPYPIVPAPVEKSWTDRHPYGKIVLGALAIVGLLSLFLCGTFGLVQFSFRQSDAYRMALARAQSNPRIVEQLGNPIHAGLNLQGNSRTQGLEGSASMTIPIIGPRGEGKIHFVAKERAGVWTFSRLDFETNAGGLSFSLLSPVIESPKIP